LGQLEHNRQHQSAAVSTNPHMSRRLRDWKR